MSEKYYVCSKCGTHHLQDLFQFGYSCQGYTSCDGKLIKPIEGRAHSEFDKAEIMKRLALAWDKHPQLRLSQLIKNTFGDKDIFYIEDESFVSAIEKFGVNDHE